MSTATAGASRPTFRGGFCSAPGSRQDFRGFAGCADPGLFRRRVARQPPVEWPVIARARHRAVAWLGAVEALARGMDTSHRDGATWPLLSERLHNERYGKSGPAQSMLPAGAPVRPASQAHEGITMADEEQLRILKQGVKAWNDWRKQAPDTRVDLRKANLSGTNLRWPTSARPTYVGPTSTWPTSTKPTSAGPIFEGPSSTGPTSGVPPGSLAGRLPCPRQARPCGSLSSQHRGQCLAPAWRPGHRLRLRHAPQHAAGPADVRFPVLRQHGQRR